MHGHQFAEDKPIHLGASHAALLTVTSLLLLMHACYTQTTVRTAHRSSACSHIALCPAHLLLLAGCQAVLVAAAAAHDRTGVCMPHRLIRRRQRRAVLGAQPAQSMADGDPQVWPLLKGSCQRLGVQSAVGRVER